MLSKVIYFAMAARSERYTLREKNDMIALIRDTERERGVCLALAEQADLIQENLGRTVKRSLLRRLRKESETARVDEAAPDT